MTITKAPDIVGTHGSAWMIDIARICERHDTKDGEHASVASWVVHAPWAHPLWHSYALILIHLRDLPNVSPARIHLPDATHELILNALDPDACFQEIIQGEADAMRWCLSPGNFAAQFIAENDDDAGARIAETVVMVCNGELNPDTDARSQWVRLFGDNMVRQ